MPEANTDEARTPRTGDLIIPPSAGTNGSARGSKKRAAAPTTVGIRAYLTLIVLVLAVFSPLLNLSPIWSDYDLPQRSDYESMDHWQEALSLTSIRKSDPISNTTYFIEQAIPLPHGLVHRSINILLHLFAAILLLRNLEALKLAAAFATTLVFALHPATVQTLYWSGYRTEIVGLILILGALHFGIRNRKASDYLYAILLTAIASLIHPAALAIPPILALIILYTAKHHHLADYNRVLPLLCICIFIGVWTSGGGSDTAAELHATEWLSQAGQNMSFFTRQALLPINTALFHSFDKGTAHKVAAEMSFLPFFLFIPFYVLIAFNIRKKWSRAFLLGLTAYLLLVIHGVSQPGQFIDGSLAHEEHGLYVALPALLALVISGAAGVTRKMGPGGQALWATGLACLMFVEIMLTASFTYALGKPTSMWQSINEQWPNSAQAKIAYIESISEAEEPLISNIELIKIINAILEDQPDQTDLRLRLLRTYLAEGQSTHALREYKRLLRDTQPDNAFLEEAAQFYEKLGFDWDANKARERIQR